MKLIELTALKGGPVWVNPNQLDYIGPSDVGGSSIYGEANVKSGAKLHFAQGSNLDVQETLAEVMTRLVG